MPNQQSCSDHKQAFKQTMAFRWRVIEAIALPMLTLLFLGLWQGLRHQTEAIRDLRLQLHELEQQSKPASTNNLVTEQLEFLQRRQESLETQISGLRRSQQQLTTQWRRQSRPSAFAPPPAQQEPKNEFVD